MRKALALVSLLFTVTFGQEGVPGYHQHKGFFISLNTGISGGAIVLTMKNGPGDKMTFSGAGVPFELKIGGAIVENLLLHADLCTRSISSPTVELDGTKGSTSSDVTAGDSYIGIGLTRYFMPLNLFVQGGVGFGTFVLNAGGSGSDANSERGFGFLIKFGKEWWVSKNWGLGVSAGYHRIAANDKGDPLMPSYSGKLSTNKLFVLFNTTYN